MRRHPTRREWLLGISRWAALGGIAAGATLLTTGSGRGCTVAAACNRCRALARCALPEAKAARTALDRRRSARER